MNFEFLPDLLNESGAVPLPALLPTETLVPCPPTRPYMVFLDLDETLYYRCKNGALSPDICIKRADRAVSRPYLLEFLKAASSLPGIVLGLYTSCQTPTVRSLLRPCPQALFPPTVDEPQVGIQDLHRFTDTHPPLSLHARRMFFHVLTRRDNVRDLEGEQAWDTMRSLERAVTAANWQAKHAWGVDNVFDESNVILVDNELRKVRENPCNAVVLPSWRGVGTDASLRQLLDLLTMLSRDAPADVRTWLPGRWCTGAVCAKDMFDEGGEDGIFGVDVAGSAHDACDE